MVAASSPEKGGWYRRKIVAGNDGSGAAQRHHLRSRKYFLNGRYVMTFRQFLLILRARYKVAVFTSLFVITATLIISVLLPKQYTASTAVVVDVKSPDPLAGMILPGLAAPGYMATQI